MSKTVQSVAAALLVAWIIWVSNTLWSLNEKVTRIEGALAPRVAVAMPHPQPDRLAAIHP